MAHWFVENAAVNPLYQRSDVYPQHVHHVLSSVDFITQQSKSGNNKEYNGKCNAIDSLSKSTKRRRRWIVPESTHFLMARVNSFASA